ncbi:MAG TPA: DNA polymerase III subunit beta [Nitrosomonas nitrosa]|jgi:DNA polymerase-3 subunit beta|uniref:Beta sliding clamp n=1 Tax=Nitrosomonas nitrosa TaxID=52442 RepID=A0A1I4PKY5_9PROT|nr:DNA polymerase III subunit beta [Nitrosomonas nitrosa]PTR00186.1 DNA polymerase III beta subunit [Nitrosomonas nitrosa]CAE6509052.1 Beta sliding clamp [Nitrosomonas nitrosa]SFM28256.1 DNA polymerase III, beta subunit [Nitrosomonas nitrosa]HBZ31256.1 DNA polymerase III subunit beta [Nitrosomonas nitrosa]HNP51558.1 DNA polymerase III subunit beta [Nitrosomonas nitrosa]
MILFKANRDFLLRPLQMVSGIVERRHTLPILSNVLIQRENGKTLFVTTDSEIEIGIHSQEHENSATELAYPAITVSAKKLLDILRTFPTDLEVTLIKSDSRLLINAGKSRFSLQMLPAEDFPRMAIEDQPEITVNLAQNVLKNLLNLVQYAMAQQDIRYYFNGLLLVVEDRDLKVITSDGHRLAYASVELENQYSKRETIIPRKTILELSKLLDDSEKLVTIEIFPKKIRFKFSEVTLLSKVIEGKFPSFNQIVAKTNSKQFRIDRLNFLQGLQRVAVLSDTSDKFRGVRLVVSKNMLSIICKNKEQEEAQEELEIEYDQETTDISFNITYLLDVLNNLNNDSVQCAFENTDSSTLFSLPDDDHFKYIVMPMRL